jgi:S-adenosylmethionine/arginine decarboxylase-like enzyme
MLDHKHLIVRAEVDKPPTSIITVKAWLTKIIDGIGMKVAQGLEANPIAYYCNLPGNRGLTAIAILETSHCAVHFWDDIIPGIMQFDLYSCANIEIDHIFNYLLVYEPKKVEFKFLDRNYGLKELSNGFF